MSSRSSSGPTLWKDVRVMLCSIDVVQRCMWLSRADDRENCSLDTYLSTGRVSIIDDDTFPSRYFKDRQSGK